MVDGNDSGMNWIVCWRKQNEKKNSEKGFQGIK